MPQESDQQEAAAIRGSCGSRSALPVCSSSHELSSMRPGEPLRKKRVQGREDASRPTWQRRTRSRPLRYWSGPLAEGKSVRRPDGRHGGKRSPLLRDHECPASSRHGYFGILEPDHADPASPFPERDGRSPRAPDRVGLRAATGWATGGDTSTGRWRSAGTSVAIGLAFESQGVPHIPETPSDVRLDMVITEKSVLKFGREPQ